MTRNALVLSVLLVGCSSTSSPTTDFEGHADPGLYVSAIATLRLAADGTRSTIVDVAPARETLGGPYPIDPTTVRVSVDGAFPIEAPLDPTLLGPWGSPSTHRIVFDGWITSLDIEATAGTDQATLASDTRITNPDQARVDLAGPVVAGEAALLRWSRQDWVAASVAFDTQVPTPRSGLIQPLTADTGSVAIDPSVFSSAGDYTLQLFRELTLQHLGAGNHLLLIWAMDWNTAVTVAPSVR